MLSNDFRGIVANLAVKCKTIKYIAANMSLAQLTLVCFAAF